MHPLSTPLVHAESIAEPCDNRSYRQRGGNHQGGLTTFKTAALNRWDTSPHNKIKDLERIPGRACQATLEPIKQIQKPTRNTAKHYVSRLPSCGIGIEERRHHEHSEPGWMANAPGGPSTRSNQRNPDAPLRLRLCCADSGREVSTSRLRQHTCG